MKKVKGLFLAALAAATMFTSCKDDDDAVGPEIKFINYDGAALTINKGDTVAFTFQAIAGDAKIVDAPVITYSFGANDPVLANSVPTEIDNGFEVAVSQVLKEAGEYTFEIYAADKDEMVDSATVNVTVKEVAIALTDKGDQTLGAQSNATMGSYLSLTESLVYKSDDAKTNQGKIDLVYYYGSSNKATIVAPNDPTVGGVEAGSLSLCKDWTVKNATKFIKKNDLDFATVTDADIAEITPTESKVNLLEKDDVIVYKTESGDMGVIKIGTITTDATGNVVVSIKVK